MTTTEKPIHYHRGMSYADFCTMLEQRRDACPHPYERIITNVRGRRATDNRIVVVVEQRCGDCDTDLDPIRRAFRVPPAGIH